MGSIKFISTEIEVGLDEWNDDDLIKEIRDRGYKVDDDNLVEAEWRWRRGDKKEALILLEREFKWLNGISELMN